MYLKKKLKNKVLRGQCEVLIKIDVFCGHFDKRVALNVFE